MGRAGKVFLGKKAKKRPFSYFQAHIFQFSKLIYFPYFLRRGRKNLFSKAFSSKKDKETRHEFVLFGAKVLVFPRFLRFSPLGSVSAA